MLHDHRLAPLGGHAPKNAVMFLHGVGDSGAGGLLEICRIWQREMPETEFLCPDAPFEFDMAPDGRQWFSLKNFTIEAMREGAVMAAPILNEYIDHVLQTRNITPAQLVLVGFSQGTIMSLYAGPRRAPAVAGILGYSGILVCAENLRFEKKSSPPVLLINGMLDEVVPFATLAGSEDGLRRAGIPVSSVACARTGHSIDALGVTEGLKFLKKVLATGC